VHFPQCLLGFDESDGIGMGFLLLEKRYSAKEPPDSSAVFGVALTFQGMTKMIKEEIALFGLCYALRRK
jgi:hypothetical protein